MEKPEHTELNQRVERLEKLVENLTAKVEQLTPSLQSQPTAPPPPPKVEHSLPQTPPKPQPPERLNEPVHPAPPIPQPSDSGFKLPDYMKQSEYWLNKIGIALLLFGAVFLFKYSVEQGWLTPQIRIVFGLFLGIVLSFFGLRLYHKRKHFSQVLLGGAIGTFYITGYAAFQIFHLVTYPVAFSFYVTVTALSFFLSLKENDFIFSLIAMLGGLGTPFLLYTGEGSVPGLMLYLCILLTGASSIYFFKGWWSFFWTTCVGGSTVIMIALYGSDIPTTFSMVEKLSVQSALFLSLPFFWLIPIARELTILKKPALLTSPETLVDNSSPDKNIINHSAMNLNLLTVIIPFFALSQSTVLWDWSDNTWGGICLIMALATAVTGWSLDKTSDFKTLAYTHMNVGLIFATIALFYFLDGNVLLVALTLMATALHLAKIKIGERTLAPIAHALFVIVSMWVALRVFESQSGAAILNMQTMADLVVAVCAIGLSFVLGNSREKLVYPIAGFALLAGIFFRELNGNDYFLTMTLLSAVMASVARIQKNDDLFGAVHVFNAGIASWLGYRLIEHSVGTTVFNYTAGADLLFIVYGVIVAIKLLSKEEKAAYLIGAHAALLMWFLRELSPLTNGQGIVSISWGVYIVALFIVGLRKDTKLITKTAMATLFVLIGKLFLVDLANLETIWRVLLFLGFGAALLFLSYYFQTLWKTKKG